MRALKTVSVKTMKAVDEKPEHARAESEDSHRNHPSGVAATNNAREIDNTKTSIEVVGQSTTQSCPICLSEFLDDEQLSCSKDAESCNHLFHTSCLQAWLLNHQSCPVCRFQMLPTLPPTIHLHIPNLAAERRVSS